MFIMGVSMLNSGDNVGYFLVGFGLIICVVGLLNLARSPLSPAEKRRERERKYRRKYGSRGRGGPDPARKLLLAGIFFIFMCCLCIVANLIIILLGGVPPPILYIMITVFFVIGCIFGLVRKRKHRKLGWVHPKRRARQPTRR